jgi:hypothetical protein
METRYNVNEDYSYLSRMVKARRKEEADYAILKRQSENIAFLVGIALFDMGIAFASFIFLL